MVTEDLQKNKEKAEISAQASAFKDWGQHVPFFSYESLWEKRFFFFSFDLILNLMAQIEKLTVGI